MPKPSFVRNKALRETAQKMIDEGGLTNHSAMGATLLVTISRLEEAKVPYKLTAVPGVGYVVEVPPPGKRLGILLGILRA